MFYRQYIIWNIFLKPKLKLYNSMACKLMINLSVFIISFVNKCFLKNYHKNNTIRDENKKNQIHDSVFKKKQEFLLFFC